VHTLSTIDAGFLLTESQHSPKHVASLQVLRLPKGKGTVWIRKLLDDLKRISPGFPFNQRLQFGNPLRPTLVPDERFEIDYHVRHAVLPHPGNEEQLLDMVARIHANLLDRERPLWEFYLIEGLAGRRFAFYTKIHHAVADGATFTRWFTESGSLTPSARNTHPIWQRHEPPEPPTGAGTLTGRALNSLRMIGATTRTTIDLAALGSRLLRKRIFEGNGNAVLPLGASRTSLNVPTGAARSLSVCRFPFEEFAATAHAHQATINDLFLALCDLAVNRYLAAHGSRPKEPLIAYMPVDLRESKIEDGNLICLLQVRLSSTHDDPLKALEQIRRASKSTREIYSGVSQPAVQLYSLAVALLPLGEELLHLDQVLPPAINLVVSNVPGPRRRMYFRGAEVMEAYPVSTLPPAVALNITLCSYAGTLFVGLVGGRTAIPDMRRLARELESAYREFRDFGRTT